MDIQTLYSQTRSKSALARARRTIQAIGQREPSLTKLSDEQIREQFQALAAVPLADRIVPGFALAREASRRTLGLRPFDVQLIGGLTLLKGQLAEMRTGEGKTLTIVAPAAVLALDGKGVHVVTANAYLATRDAADMAPVYEFLGLRVAALGEDLSQEDKQDAYLADVTYGVGHEFGFDYLKDHLVQDAGRKAQRELHVAIVDEVDSILIDEARVPLIISGQAADVSNAVRHIDAAVRTLSPGTHYIAELKEQQASLTEAGYQLVEERLSESGLVKSNTDLYAVANLPLVRRIHSAVRAYALYRRDRDYVIEGGELVLVDIGTGRKMPGRRFEDGLHEALEAKEGVAILPGSVTRATITYQNFFGLYAKLAGLTGTALTDADEFAEIYNLETVVIPTNRPIARIAHPDLVYASKSQKFNAVVDLVSSRHDAGQPVLIGCATIRDAEVVSQLLRQKGLPHELLTAKHLEREAHIVAQAGRPGAITVATNMAGRGTDIALGGEKPEEAVAGSPEFEAWQQARNAVISAKGLFVVGTERNGLRRVDNQLAGRSGRQGDPGEVQFVLSLEDDLLRVFGRDRRLDVIRKVAESTGKALSGKQVGALVTMAQKKYEGQGFDARRTLMKYDSVLAEQRKAIYSLRTQLLTDGCQSYCEGLVAEAVAAWSAQWLPEEVYPEQWDLKSAKDDLSTTFGLSLPLAGWVHKDELSAQAIEERVLQAAHARLAEQQLPEERFRQVFFRVLDELWTDHLTALEELRSAASLKGHTGQNPVYQYSKEALELFQGLVKGLGAEVTRELLQPVLEVAPAPTAPAVPVASLTPDQRVAVALEKRWVRRLDACPCDSGSRYKDCHGLQVLAR